MTLIQRLIFMMVISNILLVLKGTTEAAPAPDLIYDVPLEDVAQHKSVLDINPLDELAHNDPGFRSNICQFLCTKDPPEGGNFCNCDRHPLG